MKQDKKPKSGAGRKRKLKKSRNDPDNLFYSTHAIASKNNLLKQLEKRDQRIEALKANLERLKEEQRQLMAEITEKKAKQELSGDLRTSFKRYSKKWPYIEKVCFSVENAKEPLTLKGDCRGDFSHRTRSEKPLGQSL